MKPIALLGSLLATLGMLSLGGCKSTCQSPQDCDQGQICDQGQCVKKTPLPPPIGGPKDGGPLPDALPQLDAQPDATTSSTADAGLDGGLPIDSGSVPPDGGIIGFDAGDAGQFDSSILPNEGLIRIAENASTPTELIAAAEFYDNSAAILSTRITHFPSTDPVCTLREQHFGSGNRRGLGADHITLSTFNTPPTSIDLIPGAAGSFSPSAPPSMGFLGGLTILNVAIVSSGIPGSLEDSQLVAGVPPAMLVVAPQAGAVQLAVVPIFLAWSHRADGASLKVVLELADAMREVVLRCETTDSGAGMMMVPSDAQAAFVQTIPLAPARMRIGYEVETTGTVSLAVSAAPPFAYQVRVSQGASYPLQLP